MSNVEVTPEDRERLAKSKFGEWFDELFDKKIDEAISKRVKSTTSKTEGSTEGTTKTETGATDSGSTEQPAPRRRSLLETCLSDTFGF